MASVFILAAAVLWLAAAVAIVRVPRVAVALYAGSALTCAAGARTEPELWVWSAISLGLAVFSFHCGQVARSLSLAAA